MNPRKWIKSSGMPVIPWDHVPASQSPYALLLLSGKQLVFWKTAQNLQMTWMLVSFSAKPFLTTHPLIPNQVFRCPFSDLHGSVHLSHLPPNMLLVQLCGGDLLGPHLRPWTPGGRPPSSPWKELKRCWMS